MRDDRQQRSWLGRTDVACMMAVGLAAMIALASPVLADDNQALQQEVDAAIEQLLEEAAAMENLDRSGTRPAFRRPHRLVRGWGADFGPIVLDRMTEPFTDDEHRNVYIRWHLMPPVRQMLHQTYEIFRDTGEHRLPDGTARQLRNLASMLPPPLQRPRQEEEDWVAGPRGNDGDRREVLEINEEIERLRRQTRVTVGIPPFETHYQERAALQYVSPSRRSELELIVEQIEALRARRQQMAAGEQRIRRIRNPDAVAYNNRIERINTTVRDFRGDVVYALVQSGDRDLLRVVVDEVTQQIDNGQYIGLDLLEYMYYAVLEGYLTLYEPEDLRRAGRTLERMARQSDAFKLYRFGDEPPSTFMIGRQRNAADLAFHLIHLFQDTAVLTMFQRQAGDPPREEPFRAAGFQFTGDNFTGRDVRVAMDRAIEALRAAPQRDLQPAYMLPEEDRLARRFDQHNRQNYLHENGNHAVAAWAMLAAGESFQQPELFRRINWVLSGDSPYTYDRGMRLQMLAQMPGRMFEPWVRRDLTMLERGLPETGNWSHLAGLGEPSGWGDHAHGTYGVLGLWGAQQAGVDVDDSRWRVIDAHWRSTQQQTAGDQAAGWALGMFNVDLDEDERQRLQNISGHDRVTGPMTAAGVMVLSLTEHQLANTRHAPTDDGSMSPQLQKGLRWLDENFRFDDPNADDWFYYMWTIQRVGQITGHRRFGDVDWFRDVTAEMLNRQGRNGLWNDPSGQLGRLMSSSFALLYLSTVNTPVAVGKLQFDGAWNNRPHDIWNFSDYASDWYEHAMSWQIIEPDAPVHHLIESPILYLSSNGSFNISDAEVERLREYLEAGGMLLVNQEGGGGAAFNQSLKNLRERLLPGREFESLDASHPMMSINKHLTGGTAVQAISNDIRPLVLYFNRDLGEDLQQNQPDRSDSFALLSNTYLYTVGLNPRHTRLDQAHVQRDPGARPSQRIDAARLRHEGQYDPEPGALSQLQALLANEHDVDLQYETLSPSQLSDRPLAFLTTTGEIEMSDAEVEALSNWLENGGTLWVDAAGGSREAADGVQAFIRRLVPGRAGTRLTSRDRIVSGRGLDTGHDNRRITYRPYLLIQAGGSTTPRLHQIRINDRPAIIVSSEDLTAGLAGLGHWGIYGYTVESARNLVVNGVLDLLEDQ